MIHVAIATTTMRPKRIVYADGSVKRDLVGSPGSGGPSPPFPVSTTWVAPAASTAVSVSLDMASPTLDGNHDRHRRPRLVGKAATDTRAVASPRQQRHDTED